MTLRWHLLILLLSRLSHSTTTSSSYLLWQSYHHGEQMLKILARRGVLTIAYPTVQHPSTLSERRAEYLDSSLDSGELFISSGRTTQQARDRSYVSSSLMSRRTTALIPPFWKSSTSPEVLLHPLVVSRNESERVLIEPSVNSIRLSIAIKQADEIEKILCHKFTRFMMMRAEGFVILRRKALPVGLLSDYPPSSISHKCHPIQVI